MAVTRAQTVIKATADADVITGPIDIIAIRVAAGGSGITVNLKDGGVTGGNIVWTQILAANGVQTDYLEKLRIDANGLYVNISAGGGTVYLYVR
jgi:hypothetical protein